MNDILDGQKVLCIKDTAFYSFSEEPSLPPLKMMKEYKILRQHVVDGTLVVEIAGYPGVMLDFLMYFVLV